MFSEIVLEKLDNKEYAIVVTKYVFKDLEEMLIVYDTEQLKKFLLTDEDVSKKDIIVGAIGAVKNDLFYSKCGGAISIGLYFSNKKGFGATLIKLLSSFYKTFITSDRKHSDTPSSKKLWNKIEASGEWEMKKLNNFYLDDRGRKVFVSLDQDRNLTRLNGRETQETNDDCILAQYDQSSPEQMAHYTGTPYAFKFNGDAGLQRMQKAHQDFSIQIYRDSLAKKIQPIRPKDIDRNLVSLTKELWDEIYNGPNG